MNKITYNILLENLTEADIEEINNYPVPTADQAKMAVEIWTSQYGTKQIDTPNELVSGLVAAKMYYRCTQTHPEYTC